MTEILILAVYLPGNDQPLLGGFVLVEEGSDDYAIVFRRHWAQLCDLEDAEVLDGMEQALQDLARHGPIGNFLSEMENRFSNVIRCLERIKLPNTVSLDDRRSLLERALI